MNHDERWDDHARIAVDRHPEIVTSNVAGQIVLPGVTGWSWSHTSADGSQLAIDVDPYAGEDPDRRAQLALTQSGLCITTDLSPTTATHLAQFLIAWAAQ